MYSKSFQVALVLSLVLQASGTLTQKPTVRKSLSNSVSNAAESIKSTKDALQEKLANINVDKNIQLAKDNIAAASSTVCVACAIVIYIG